MGSMHWKVVSRAGPRRGAWFPGSIPGAGLVRSTREEHVMWDPVDWDLVCDGEATEDDWWSWAEAEES